jgi:3-(3-hydroxy-phenyl)propionate hydroxylase
VMQEFVQAQTMRNKAALETGSAANQAQAQAFLSEVAADPVKRRAYILNQAMVTSLRREASVT